MPHSFVPICERRKMRKCNLIPRYDEHEVHAALTDRNEQIISNYRMILSFRSNSESTVVWHRFLRLILMPILPRTMKAQTHTHVARSADMCIRQAAQLPYLHRSRSLACIQYINRIYCVLRGLYSPPTSRGYIPSKRAINYMLEIRIRRERTYIEMCVLCARF